MVSYVGAYETETTIVTYIGLLLTAMSSSTLKVWENSETFSIQTSLSSWLRAITRIKLNKYPLKQGIALIYRQRDFLTRTHIEKGFTLNQLPTYFT